MPTKSNQVFSRKKIETILPLERILRVFHSRFDDASCNPLAFLTSQDFAETFRDVPKNHVEEALFHYANYADDRTLKTEVIDYEGRPTRVWHIRASRREPDLDSGAGESKVPG